MTVVLVDVDGTLLRRPSAEFLFAIHLARRQRIGPHQIASAALFVPRWAGRFGPQVFRKNKAYLAGLAVEEVNALAEAFVRDDLAERMRAPLLRRLDAHRATGDRIALVSGTPDFIARPLAARVGAELWSATMLAQSNGAFTAEPPEVHPFGDDKVGASRALCARLDSALEDCTAYGNGIHDLPLLRRVAHPVAVCPDRQLKRIARREGWEILGA